VSGRNLPFCLQGLLVIIYNVCTAKSMHFCLLLSIPTLLKVRWEDWSEWNSSRPLLFKDKSRHCVFKAATTERWKLVKKVIFIYSKDSWSLRLRLWCWGSDRQQWWSRSRKRIVCQLVACCHWLWGLHRMWSGFVRFLSRTREHLLKMKYWFLWLPQGYCCLVNFKEYWFEDVGVPHFD